MTLENLTYEVRDAIAHVAINRPKSLNALNADTLGELRQVFEAIQKDDAVRVAILTGVGEKAFVAGADIGEMRELDAAGGRALAEAGQDPLQVVLTGEFIDGARAAEIGLVNAVVPADALGPACESLARQMAAGGPVAVRQALDAVNRGLDGSLADGLQIEAENFGTLFDTGDAREGISAFLEKRRATFQGR